MEGNDPQWRWRKREKEVNSPAKTHIHSFMWDNIYIDVHIVQRNSLHYAWLITERAKLSVNITSYRYMIQNDVMIQPAGGKLRVMHCYYLTMIRD